MREPDKDSDSSRQRSRRLSTTGIQAQLRAKRSTIERQVHEAKLQIDSANERIEARAGRNLLLAIGIGLILGVGVVLSLVFVKEVFILVAALAIGLTTFELATALNRVKHRVDNVPLVIGAFIIVVGSYFADSDWRWILIVCVVSCVIIWRCVSGFNKSEDLKTTLRDAAISVLVTSYVPYLASFAVVLLTLDGGQWWVLGFIILVISIDIGAYTAGILFGKHPMAPRISPKKTWEGFAGASIGAVIAGGLVAVFMLDIPVWFGALFGLLMLVTATLGDLGESLLKRDLGIKDMSSWLPGHGGFLDRLDSLLPSAPFALGAYMLSAALFVGA